MKKYLAIGAAVFALVGVGTGAASASSLAQRNAAASAKDYLGTMAFSRSGLIHQLKYEGYSTRDATHAVTSVHANWYREAAKKAKDYLDTMPFSRSGLIAQLRYEGFTPAQASYGVSRAGL